MNRYKITEKIISGVSAKEESMYCKSVSDSGFYFCFDGERIFVSSLRMGTTYYKMPFEIRNLQRYQKTYLDKAIRIPNYSVRCTFNGIDHTYNWNNDKFAFCLNGRIYSVKVEKIDFYAFIGKGFKRNIEMYVPFSEREGYVNQHPHERNHGPLIICYPF